MVLCPSKAAMGVTVTRWREVAAASSCSCPPVPVCDGPHAPPGRTESRFPDLSLPWGALLGMGNTMRDTSLALDSKHLKICCGARGAGGRRESWRAVERRKDPTWGTRKSPRAWEFPTRWVSGGSPEMDTGELRRVFEQMREGGGGSSGREPGSGLDARCVG